MDYGTSNIARNTLNLYFRICIVSGLCFRVEVPSCNITGALEYGISGRVGHFTMYVICVRPCSLPGKLETIMGVTINLTKMFPECGITESGCRLVPSDSPASRQPF